MQNRTADFRLEGRPWVVSANACLRQQHRSTLGFLLQRAGTLNRGFRIGADLLKHVSRQRIR